MNYIHVAGMTGHVDLVLIFLFHENLSAAGHIDSGGEICGHFIPTTLADKHSVDGVDLYLGVGVRGYAVDRAESDFDEIGVENRLGNVVLVITQSTSPAGCTMNVVTPLSIV